MSMILGTAPDSWGVWFPNDPKQIPAERFLDEVALAGYEYIELGPFGYLPSTEEELAPALARRGLKVCAATVIGNLEDPHHWGMLETQVLGGGELASRMGGKFLVLIDEFHVDPFTGVRTAPAQLDRDAWKRLIDTTNRIARLSEESLGLSVVVHPHAETHIEYEQQIEQLMRDTDPIRVSVCLDTGHHAYCGGDPVAFMQKHHARIPYLHLKSVDAEVQKQVKPNQWPFAKAVSMDVFCEPATGMVDFPAFVDVLKGIDFHGWGIVEQDMYPAPFDKPFPIAQRTHAYLKSMGL
jgi:inosose dehydratase